MEGDNKKIIIGEIEEVGKVKWYNNKSNTAKTQWKNNLKNNLSEELKDKIDFIFSENMGLINYDTYTHTTKELPNWNKDIYIYKKIWPRSFGSFMINISKSWLISWSYYISSQIEDIQFTPDWRELPWDIVHEWNRGLKINEIENIINKMYEWIIKEKENQKLIIEMYKKSWITLKHEDFGTKVPFDIDNSRLFAWMDDQWSYNKDITNQIIEKISNNLAQDRRMTSFGYGAFGAYKLELKHAIKEIQKDRNIFDMIDKFGNMSIKFEPKK